MSGKDKEPTLTLCEAVACLAVPCNPIGVEPDMDKHHILKLKNPTPENIQDWYGNIITAMKQKAEGKTMAKITSADCKAWIVANESPETKASDWKRREKYKLGDAVVRVFENDVAGEAVGIVERNGEIIGAQQEEGHIPEKKEAVTVLYWFSKEESEDDPGSHELCFGSVVDWEKRGCQSDSDIDGVFEVMSTKLGIYEDAENFYLIPADKLVLVKETLEADPRFGVNDKFSKFMESCD
jgi:hypothetical protein